jgi:predicted permease
MSRAATRTKEVGIRTALGASKFRIVLQFLSEAALLALAGALFGLGIGWVGVRAFNAAIVSTNPPSWIDIRIDGVAVLFTLGLALLATLVAGAIPALHAARANVNDILKDESRGASSFRLGRISKGIVIVEIALSCGLLIGAGLMIKSVTQLRTIDFGFPTDVFTARIALMEGDYPDSIARDNFFNQLLPRLEQIPDLESATVATALPGLGSGGPNVRIEGEEYDLEGELPWARANTIAPNYFETFGIRLYEGRAFIVQDRLGSLRVAIVNRAFAAKFFDGESAIGRRFRTGRDENAPWITIVGVVPNMFENGIDDGTPEAIYLPLGQQPPSFASIAARTRGEPLAVTQKVREAITAIDQNLPIYFARTLQSAIDQSYWFYQVFGVLFMIFGAAALFLAGVGLYGVMATSVAQRTREMGVRMALGAQARDVIALIFRQGLVQITIGIGLGLGLAVGVSTLLTIVLYQVNPRDPVVFASIIGFLLAVASLACFVPARRATRVDPNVALRVE